MPLTVAVPVDDEDVVAGVNLRVDGTENGARERLERGLHELGYGIALEGEGFGAASIEADQSYLYIIEQGPVALADVGGDGLSADGEGIVLSGQTLIDLSADDLSRPQTLAESKRLLRALINHSMQLYMIAFCS